MSSGKTKFINLVQELDRLVRSAQIDSARQILLDLKLRDVPREILEPLANLANRMGEPFFALRILNPIIRGEERDKATVLETIRYAHALRRLGAAEEAIGLLEKIDASESPEVLLQIANCHSTLWNYREAIPYLHKYINSVDPDSYQAQVARINYLSAAIQTEDGNTVDKLKSDLTQRLNENESALLYSNFLELQAKWAIHDKQYSEALRILDRARVGTAHSGPTWDALQVEKWTIVAQSFQAQSVVPEMQQLRQKAVAHRQWEVARDCDFYSAEIEQNRDLFLYLYFGSPFPFFREKIAKRIGAENLPQQFLTKKNPDQILDVVTGTVNGTNLDLKHGHALHKILMTLSSDFYKPFSLLTVFARLHPGEYFIPVHSANRVHQSITRFRQWVEDHHLPLQLLEEAGTYQLHVTSETFALAIPADTRAVNGSVISLNRARAHFNREFTTVEMTEFLEGSRSSTQRLLKTWIDEGQLETIGSGATRKYRFVA